MEVSVEDYNESKYLRSKVKSITYHLIDWRPARQIDVTVKTIDVFE